MSTMMESNGSRHAPLAISSSWQWSKCTATETEAWRTAWAAAWTRIPLEDGMAPGEELDEERGFPPFCCFDEAHYLL